jgi:hypothetical protein
MLLGLGEVVEARRGGPEGVDVGAHVLGGGAAAQEPRRGDDADADHGRTTSAVRVGEDREEERGEEGRKEKTLRGAAQRLE